MSRALQAITAASTSAWISARRQAQAAEHSIGGPERKAQLRASADKLKHQAEELQRARDLVAALLAIPRDHLGSIVKAVEELAAQAPADERHE